jgi:hypothetical protein
MLGVFAEAAADNADGALRVDLTYRAQDTFMTQGVSKRNDAVEGGGKSGINL